MKCFCPHASCFWFHFTGFFFFSQISLLIYISGENKNVKSDCFAIIVRQFQKVLCGNRMLKDKSLHSKCTPYLLMLRHNIVHVAKPFIDLINRLHLKWAV